MTHAMVAATVAGNARGALQNRIVAVLNIGSGGCNAGCEAEAKSIFDQARLAHAIVITEPGQMNEALDAAVQDADVLMVLGGDGTIAAAASRCGVDTLLIPLPGGTMNMLPQALYGQRSWREALADTLANPAIREVSGGKAGGHPFFCAAILGAPSLWAQAREAVREGAVVEAIKRSVTAARRSLTEPLDYHVGGSSGSAEAVVVICPVISKDLANDECMLEVAAVDPATATSLFGLAFKAAFDDWRNGSCVSLAEVKNLRVSGHGEVPAMLDGETVRGSGARSR